MNVQSTIRKARSPLVAALLLVAFCLHALIPVGYMPGPDGLVICSGYTPVPGPAIAHTMSATSMGDDMDMSVVSTSGITHHGAHPGKKGGVPEHGGASLCPFAAAMAVMAGAQTAIPIGIARVVSTRIGVPPQQLVARATPAPTHLPRGPPTTSSLVVLQG